MNNNELTEQLFKAIDAIVDERLRSLPYDKTIVATVINIDDAAYGRYKVTTDTNITFYAYSDMPYYKLQERVYVRIPENDYTKQKIITGKYIADDKDTPLNDYWKKKTEYDEEYAKLQTKYNEQNENYNQLLNQYTDLYKSYLDLLNKYKELSKNKA